jgi:hypothetical protein
MVDIPSAFNIASIAIGFVAAICLCIGAATTTPKSIALASATIVDSNPTLMRSLSAQRSQYIVGALFLIVTFARQAAAVLTPKDSQLQLPLFFQSPLVLLFSVLLVAGAVAFLAISRITTTTEKEAMGHLQ